MQPPSAFLIDGTILGEISYVNDICLIF